MGFFLSGVGSGLTKEDMDTVIENVSNSVVVKIDGIIDSKFDSKTQELTNKVNEVVITQEIIDEEFNNVVMCKTIG